MRRRSASRRQTCPAAEAATLADLLGYAARAARDDPAYQRELRAWTDTGLTPVAAQTQLVVTTIGDGRGDHLLAGAALEEIWLAAVHAGLVASVLTEPLRLFGVRSLIAQRLILAGFPQALLRIGYPTPVRPPRTPITARQSPGS